MFDIHARRRSLWLVDAEKVELAGREQDVGLVSGSRLEQRLRSAGQYEQNQTKEISNENNSIVGYAKAPKVGFG